MLASVEIPELLTNHHLSLSFFEGGYPLMSVFNQFRTLFTVRFQCQDLSSDFCITVKAPLSSRSEYNNHTGHYCFIKRQ